MKIPLTTSLGVSGRVALDISLVESAEGLRSTRMANLMPPSRRELIVVSPIPQKSNYKNELIK